MEIRKITTTDHDWPSLLNELPERDIPEMLYAIGEPPFSKSPLVAIVGTRRPTPSGIKIAEALTETLVRMGVVTVSGLALGIDGVVHRQTIVSGGKTIAVVGSGLDMSVLYPKRHHELARKIVETGGALISEYEPTTAPAPWTFPKRNRIIAGIAHATIVVEAAEKSGARITARLATEYNRDVAAVPGNIFSDLSKGTNQLIKSGAFPITHPDDLYEFLSYDNPLITPEKTEGADDPLLQYFDGERTVEDILARTAYTKEELFAKISEYEIRGTIKRIGGSVYQRIR